MKYLKVLVVALSASVFAIACQPNGDNNSTDVDNSNKEGAIDSTKIPNFDTAAAIVDTAGAM